MILNMKSAQLCLPVCLSFMLLVLKCRRRDIMICSSIWVISNHHMLNDMGPASLRLEVLYLYKLCEMIWTG